MYRRCVLKHVIDVIGRMYKYAEIVVRTKYDYVLKDMINRKVRRMVFETHGVS